MKQIHQKLVSTLPAELAFLPDGVLPPVFYPLFITKITAQTVWTVLITLPVCCLKAKNRHGIAASDNNIDAAVGLFIIQVVNTILLRIAAVTRAPEGKKRSYHFNITSFHK